MLGRLKRLSWLLIIPAIVFLPATTHGQSGKRDAACLIGQDGGCVYSPLVAQRYELVLTTECGAWHDQLKADNPDVLTFVYNSGTDNYTYPHGADNGWYYASREHAWLIQRCRELGYSPEILYLHYYENTVVSGFTIPGTYSSTVTDADSVSRVPVYLGYYEGSGVGRMLVNFSHPVTRQLQIEYAKKAWTDPNAGDDWPQSSYWDGIYLDNWLGNALHPGMGLTGSVTSGGRLAEHPTHAVIGSWDAINWFQDQMNLYARQLRDSLHNGAAWSPDGKAKYLCTNIANTWKNEFPDPSVAGIDYLLQEYQYNPVRSYAEDVVAAYSRDSACYSNGVHTIYCALQTETPSSASGSVTQAEALYGNLAWYYVTRGYNTLLYQMHLAPGDFWIDPAIAGWDSLSWRGCMDFDVGTSRGRYAVFQEGTDPTGQSYTIYQREYSNALVLLRARIQWNHNITPETAVQFTLPSAYRQVQINGSLGPLSTTFSMANGRGLILAKPEGGQSQIIPPSPFAPANGAVIAELQPTLVVNNAQDAESRSLRYEFQLDGNGDFVGGDLIESFPEDISAPNGTTTAWSLPQGLTDGSSYDWRCRVSTVSGAADTSDWSAIFSFIVPGSGPNQPPPVPVGLSPIDGDTVSTAGLQLIVQNVTDPNGDPVWYQFLLIADDALVDDQEYIPAEPGPTTTWEPTVTLAQDKAYTWRVQCNDPYVYSGWSPHYPFYCGNLVPPQPNPHSPLDGDTILSQNMVLSLYNVTDPDGDVVTYDFQIWSDAEMTILVDEVTGVAPGIDRTSWLADVTPDNNAAYWWRGRAVDDLAPGEWSDLQGFVASWLVVESSSSANFTASLTSGCAPLAVAFTDLSTGDNISWEWTFGEGSTSAVQNPSHEYTDPGIYTVSLTVTGPGGSDSEKKTDYITIDGGPIADFTGLPVAGEAPLTVGFADRSTGAVSWAWDFGDGGASSEQNPRYTYTEAGTFAVTLTAANQCDSDQVVKTAYITVAEPRQNLMHVEAINVTVRAWWVLRRAEVMVRILDASGLPVTDAVVTGLWSGGAQGTAEFTTGADGWGMARYKWRRGDATIAFCVTGVAKFGWAYDVAANAVTCADNYGDLAGELASLNTEDIEEIEAALGQPLAQNHPNPFNSTTQISFFMPAAGHVAVDIYDLLGRHMDNLLDEHLDAGVHSVLFNSTDDRGQKFASGMYFYRITFNGRESLTKKMVLLK